MLWCAKSSPISYLCYNLLNVTHSLLSDPPQYALICHYLSGAIFSLQIYLLWYLLSSLLVIIYSLLYDQSNLLESDIYTMVLSICYDILDLLNPLCYACSNILYYDLIFSSLLAPIYSLFCDMISMAYYLKYSFSGKIYYDIIDLLFPICFIYTLFSIPYSLPDPMIFIVGLCLFHLLFSEMSPLCLSPYLRLLDTKKNHH